MEFLRSNTKKCICGHIASQHAMAYLVVDKNYPAQFRVPYPAECAECKFCPGFVSVK